MYFIYYMSMGVNYANEIKNGVKYEINKKCDKFTENDSDIDNVSE